jgi:DNA-binding IclR family transcriptional regulator
LVTPCYRQRTHCQAVDETLHRAIDDTWRDGFAETHNKRIDEGASISSLVRGAGNEIMGALTVSIPISRYTPPIRTRTIQAVTNAARALSVQLGSSP